MSFKRAYLLKVLEDKEDGEGVWTVKLDKNKKNHMGLRKPICRKMWFDDPADAAQNWADGNGFKILYEITDIEPGEPRYFVVQREFF